MELFVQNLAVFTLDITKIMVIMHYFLKIKMVRDLKKMLGSLGALLLGSAIFTIFNENRYALFLYLGVVVATSIFLFQMKPLKIVFISMLILIMGCMLDVITKLTISITFRSQELYENIYISFLCSIITISFLIVIGATHQSKIQGSIATLNVKFLVILFVDIIVNTLVMSFFEYMIKEEQAVMDKPLMVVTVIGVAIGIYVQIGLLIYLAIAKDYLKERNDLNQYYLDLFKDHYEYLKQKESTTKKFRHDMQNHLLVMKTLCEKEDISEMGEYLNRMGETIVGNASVVQTGNDMVDAIVNKFVESAKQHQIEFKVKGHIPIECKIDTYDLCTIFSNLLSNAVENTKDCDTKWIELILRYDESQIYVDITNPYKGDVQYEKGEITTRKKDKEHHGFGLQNIKNSVESYDGLIQISTENQEFHMRLAIPNTMDKKSKNG